MIGSKLGDRYEIIGELGRGGMGIVYLGRDLVLGREVAIKHASPAAMSAETEARFLREAQTVARMDHPSIVPIYDVGRHDGSIFFVMPVVRGETLRDRLRRGALSPRDAALILRQVAEAVAYSHARGVVHRDIKPENVLLEPEGGESARVRVMDFGLAFERGDPRLTEKGMIVGTVAYMSPEQVTLEPLDARTDIWSLGVLLWECLAGEPPFVGRIDQVLHRIVNEPPPPFTSLCPDIDPALERILLGALIRNRESRTREASEIVEGLRRWLDQTPGRSTGLSPVQAHSTVALERHQGPRFVGRTRELTRLQVAAAACASGGLRFIGIVGETGVGKTRLCEALDANVRANGVRVLRAHVIEQGGYPYQGFCELVADAFRAKDATPGGSGPIDLSDLAPDLIGLFPVLGELESFRSATSAGGSMPDLPPRIAPTAAPASAVDRVAIFEILARTFSRIGGGKPLVLILENLHTADVSIEALDYIAQRLSATPTLVVGTWRPELVDRRHPLRRILDSFRSTERLELIELAPFDASEHREFVRSRLPSYDGRPALADEALISRLFEASGGNPFFSGELLRSLESSRRIERSGDGVWALADGEDLRPDELPATIQQVVEERIEGFPASSREVLSVASVLGRTFEFQDLEALVDVEAASGNPVETLVDELLRQGLFEEERGNRGERLSFSDGIVCDVIYSTIPRRRRRGLHRRAAERLEARSAGRIDRVVPLLLHHWSQADHPEKSVEYGLRAARSFLEAFAPIDGARAARTALEFLEEPGGVPKPGAAEARELLARAERMQGDLSTALENLRVAVSAWEKEGDPRRACAAAALAGEIAWEARQADLARRWIESAIERSRKLGEDGILLRVLSLAATAASLRGDTESATAYFHEADRLRKTEASIPGADTLPDGGMLRVALPNILGPPDPALARSVEHAEALSPVFETLVRIDEQGHPAPGLAEHWESLSGGAAFLLVLRPEVRFHDGRPLDSEAVRISFERSIRALPEIAPPAFAAIRGFGAFREGVTKTLAGIDAIDSRTVRIELVEPLPIYPALLTGIRTAIALPSVDGDKLVGTGAFQVARMDASGGRLERAARLGAGNPAHLDAIEFVPVDSSLELANLVREGQFDVAHGLPAEDLEQLLRDRRLRLSLYDAPRKNVWFILFASGGAAGKNAELRAALGSLVSGGELVRRTIGRLARPATGFYPPGLLGHDPGRRSTISRIDASLAESGRGVTLRAVVHPSFRQRYAALDAEIRRRWIQIGVDFIDTTPTMDEFSTRGLEATGVDLMLARWVADYDDPDDFTYSLFHSVAGQLRSWFHDPGLDRLMEKARSETDPEVRLRIYRRIETWLLETGYLVPLFHDIDVRIARPTVLGLHVRGSFPYVDYASLARAVSPESGGAGRRPGVLEIPVPGELESLDPSRSLFTWQTEIFANIFETLTCESEEGRIVPWLAEKVEPLEGGRRYRIVLRQGVRFHDGRRLGARDVRETFERILKSPDCETRHQLAPIVGASDLVEGRSQTLSGFHVVSETEFIIALERPVPFFSAILAIHSLAILPEGNEAAGNNWRDGVVGTGPFRVVRFDRTAKLELEANPFYWRPGLPRSEAIVFHMGVDSTEVAAGLRSGAFSIGGDLPAAETDSLRKDSNLKLQFGERPTLSTYFLVLNSRQGPLADEALRRRLVSSIDLDALVRRTVAPRGVRAISLVPPGLSGAEPPRRPRAGTTTSLPPLPSGPLTILFQTVYESTWTELTSGLVDRLAQGGFETRSIELRTDYRKILSENRVDLFLARWIADFPDADSFGFGLLHSEMGLLGHFVGQPDLDRLLASYRNEIDPAVRRTIFEDIERLLRDRALLIPLFHEQATRFARPEIEGFEMRSSSPMVSLERLSRRE